MAPTETGSVPLSVFRGWISAVKSHFIRHISQTASNFLLQLFQLYPHSFSHTFNPHSWQTGHPLQTHLLALSHIYIYMKSSTSKGRLSAKRWARIYWQSKSWPPVCAPFGTKSYMIYCLLRPYKVIYCLLLPLSLMLYWISLSLYPSHTSVIYDLPVFCFVFNVVD